MCLPVARRPRIGGYGNRKNLSDTRGCVDHTTNTVVAYEVCRCSLGDLFTRESGTLNGCLDELWVVLYNGIVLQRMEENNLSFDHDRVGNSDGDVAEIIRNDGPRYDHEAFSSVDDQAHSPLPVLRESIQLHRHRAVDVHEALHELRDRRV